MGEGCSSLTFTYRCLSPRMQWADKHAAPNWRQIFLKKGKSNKKIKHVLTLSAQNNGIVRKVLSLPLLKKKYLWNLKIKIKWSTSKLRGIRAGILSVLLCVCLNWSSWSCGRADCWGMGLPPPPCLLDVSPVHLSPAFAHLRLHTETDRSRNVLVTGHLQKYFFRT